MAKDHGSSVKNDKQYEGLRKKGMSKSRAAAIANTPDASKKGGKKSGSGSAASRSMAQRNAASVLPEPVGAEMSVCSPVAIAGQACAWTSVGRSNAFSNHWRTAGVKASSGTFPG